MLECIRCNRVEASRDATWLTATITCEDLTDTLALCTDCQRTLHWTARNLLDFARRQTQGGWMTTIGGTKQ